MSTKNILISLFALELCLLLLGIYLYKKRKNKKEISKNTGNDKLTNESKIINKVVINAVKKNNDKLSNITNCYIFDVEKENESSDDKEIKEDEERIPDLSIEATHEDDSVIQDLDDNENYEDILQMEKVLMNMGNVKETDPEENKNVKVVNDNILDNYDMDDSVISDYINNDFIDNIDED